MVVRKNLSVTILITVFCSGLHGHADAQPPCHARNVILIIGDGMGLAQVSYLMNSIDAPIAWENFPVVGFQKTYSASSPITDSGAAATAMSCGIKTYNSAIGVDVDTIPCTGLFELAERNHKRTGLVVTSSIVHATPAAFVAHEALRGFYEAIAVDISKSGVDYFAGGGEEYFNDRYNDNRDLVAEMRGQGYTISAFDQQTFHAFSKNVYPQMGYFTAAEEPLPKSDGREDLSDFVSHALKVLTTYDTSGFILMVEGSQIDFACHHSDPYYLLQELKDMNDAVGVAYQFASGRDDTLVIITADHETGYLSIRPSVPGRKVHVEFMTHDHSYIMVPVYAYGPCAESFTGIYENTAIFDKIRSATGL